MAALMMLAAGCSKENPFDDGDAANGYFMKSALSVDLRSDENVKDGMPTRADVNINDFNVIFTKVGDSAPFATYKFGEMPDPVVLPQGEYTCTATLGENRNAAWNSPYFLGTSESFEIKANEITSYIDPIECKLENVKVSIKYDPQLKSAVSADSYVEVKLGKSESLKFSADEIENVIPGYFKHNEETTLVATFYGNVDGVQAVETKSYVGVQKGYHYKITFKKHSGAGDPTGTIESDVMVDASVIVTDVATNIDMPEDELLSDDERPKEDGGGEDPQQQAPTITAKAPVNIDAVNDGNSLQSCIIDIHSYSAAGITAFTCDIDSPTLTQDELADVGLDSHLDLVNPGSLEEPLISLGFAVNVGGRKDVQFDLTGFLPLLQTLGSSEHHFILTVTDAYGTTVKTLKIKY